MMAPPRDSRSADTTTESRTGARHARAAEVGRAIADELGDPAAFVAALRAGLLDLAEPDALAARARLAPGIGASLGVRTPLLDRVARAFADETRDDRPGSLLHAVDRCFREPELEFRWFALSVLRQTLAVEPERSWQLLRRAAREAGDWITVDTLARAYATGILAEPYRWAEVEQLVYSPSRWERRLVGSTIATVPLVDPADGPSRGGSVVGPALPILATLIGDAEPEVQKTLAWAYRTLAVLDPAGTAAALEAEAATAEATDDGHRARVIRDTVSVLDPVLAARLRDRLAGIPVRPGTPSTSVAAEMAAQFGGLPDPSTHPEPPLT